MEKYLPVFTSPSGESETLSAYQNVLDQWPVPYTEKDISTSFGVTHIIVSGPETVPPVVLLHALFGTAASWYRTVGGLNGHYRTYAVDVMGEANKSRPTRPISSLDDYLGWFTELIDSLGISSMYLAGNSFGGFTAAYYAMCLPERIKKVVFIGPAATFNSMMPFYFNMFIPKAVYLAFPWFPLKRYAMSRSVEWMFAGLDSDTKWKRLFNLVMLHGRMTSRVMPRVYTHEEFARIKVPALLILGDHEKIYPVPETILAAKRLMPDIQSEIIPNAHHITALAQPDLVNASFLRFFQKNSYS